MVVSTDLPPAARAAFYSARLYFRPWSMEDAEAYHAIFGDPRVVWWQSQPQSAVQTRHSLQRVLERQGLPRQGLGRFAMVARGTSEVVGNLMLCPAGFAEGIEVGYHVAAKHWGKGIATEAALAALRHGFERLGLSAICAAVAQGNAASHRVMAKLPLSPTTTLVHAGLPHQLYEGDLAQWRQSQGARSSP